MSEYEKEPGEGEQPEREQTVDDLEPPEEQAGDVTGGTVIDFKEVDAQ
jgi:hypothetical protein